VDKPIPVRPSGPGGAMDWHALLQTLKENGVCRATERAVVNAPTVGSAVGMAAFIH
jgi:hypothetical protein